MRVLRAHDVLPEPPIEDSTRLLTISEVARELRCSKGHVLNLIHGRVAHMRPLPIVPLGRRRLIRQSSLREWLKASEHFD
jgi:excisionase family DNA binding protein